ncbi:hypothetical protein B4U80_06802 [Leptotrombidium deliense]|uniref:Uncharacterized protein n=1 Tax=Leptotrombidium deliense TaxID=299467 RepID=A0A443S4X5_9ACAR|nr:hypothetical protein B4U80_06802 [Leptotrombidium deliense]
MDAFDGIIKVGLIFGAVFQLLCIAAVFWVPITEENKEGSESSDDDVSVEGSSYCGHKHVHSNAYNKRSRHEKKKRR